MAETCVEGEGRGEGRYFRKRVYTHISVPIANGKGKGLGGIFFFFYSGILTLLFACFKQVNGGESPNRRTSMITAYQGRGKAMFG